MERKTEFRNIHVRADVHETLRDLAYYERRPMATILAQAVEEYAERNPVGVAR